MSYRMLVIISMLCIACTDIKTEAQQPSRAQVVRLISQVKASLADNSEQSDCRLSDPYTWDSEKEFVLDSSKEHIAEWQFNSRFDEVMIFLEREAKVFVVSVTVRRRRCEEFTIGEFMGHPGT